VVSGLQKFMIKVFLFDKDHLKKLNADSGSIYYLSDDYLSCRALRDRLGNLKNLAKIFDDTLQAIKPDYLDLTAHINKTHSSSAWWQGSIASRNSVSTHLLRDIVYFFCAVKIIEQAATDVTFIIDNQGLRDMLRALCLDKNILLRDKFPFFSRLGSIAKRLFRYTWQTVYFFAQSIKNHILVKRTCRCRDFKSLRAGRNILLRSWVTAGNFEKDGSFSNRNFGGLGPYLQEQGYVVWVLSMPLGFGLDYTKLLRSIENCPAHFLLPEYFLKPLDYIGIFLESCRGALTRVQGAAMRGYDLSRLFNETIADVGLGPAAMMLNLACPMLKRLKDYGADFDRAIYAFENNPSEKPFILAWRKFFPQAKIIAFQHTAFFSNQLAHSLAPQEATFHPLPDKIICSGPQYIRLHAMCNFPERILISGPNLRFNAVYKDVVLPRPAPRAVLLPLTFSHDLAFELFTKTKEALGERGECKVYIRTHFLLSKSRLQDFLEKLGLVYEFADSGSMQDWFPRVEAVLSNGGSITILEAVVAGVPVIRVVNDNTFFLDPFYWLQYPLKPINIAGDIKKQLEFIEVQTDNDMFKKIAPDVLKAYFTRPSEENMKVFIDQYE
jgi:hypothetical protein